MEMKESPSLFRGKRFAKGREFLTEGKARKSRNQDLTHRWTPGGRRFYRRNRANGGGHERRQIPNCGGSRSRHRLQRDHGWLLALVVIAAFRLTVFPLSMFPRTIIR